MVGMGKVTFVGAGCGDPRLLTLRAAEVIGRADYVLYDAEVHPEVLGRVREGATRAPVSATMSAEQIGVLLSNEAKQGKSAVRLTWGDPLLFAWGDVEAASVARHGVPIEVVPGIGPFIAVGAFAGVPLTRSSDASPSVSLVSVTRGHEALHDWQKLATATDSLAILCDAESLAETARSLVFYGRSPNEAATVVESVSLPSQRVIESTLGMVPELPQPQTPRVVLVVGERARPMGELTWLSKQPLFGKRVLVTRAREQAGGAAAMLRERGADPVVVPTIEIHPPSDPSAMIDAVQSMGERYDWVVLTSANGVDRLWAEMRRQGKDARAFGKAKIAAIGPGTAAALERCCVTADVIAKEHRGEALAQEVLAAITPGTKPRVLIARAEVARDVVPDTLRAAGCEVDVVSVYKTRSPPRALLEALSSLLEGGEIDAVTFTSSSTVEHLCDALEARAIPLLAKTVVASIGPITTETAKKRGIRVDVMAAEYTIPGLVSALEKHFGI
ncbi:MAG: uroporphyrinogen methyltransferase / synthase [Myxococcales bacterium]|nr:uroporphyrinogen methyltransferase / synthase [Myxococcales bacterium]